MHRAASFSISSMPDKAVEKPENRRHRPVEIVSGGMRVWR